MLFVLSPAKALDYDSVLPTELPHSKPLFPEQSAELIAVLQQYAPQQIASLMGISDKLAMLNVARYIAWQPKSGADNARQALLAFNGDVYEGLQAATLSMEQLQWAQQHLCILSGLYGVLRPLDWMQPYRLEMGTALPTARGKNLYQFWGSQIADYLRHRMDEQSLAKGADKASAHILVNLASQEYFKAVDCAALRARVIDCVFEDYKGGVWKIITFYAKRARGLMMRHCIETCASHPRDLMSFNSAGYAYAPEVSSADRLVFRRRNAD